MLLLDKMWRQRHTKIINDMTRYRTIQVQYGTVHVWLFWFVLDLPPPQAGAFLSLEKD